MKPRVSILRFIAMAWVASLICACSSTATSIDRVARAAELPNAPYSNLLVIGVAPKAANSRRFEDALAAELTNDRTQARPNHREGSVESLSDTIVREAASSMGADAVLITSLKHVSSDVSVRSERIEVDRERKDENLIDFFRYDYKEYTTPASIDLSYNVVLVTDLYDVDSGKKVYFVESSTMDAETAFEIILAESTAIARRLREDGIVR